ncbi:hypothetical protein SFRURICE_003986 [Spodoptera frugiperda]|nr:hypothetical protein SFRURICE_003986 [Spodoptera frugiperda]
MSVQLIFALIERCVMLCCCGCVWLPLIIFIGTHSLALEICFIWKDHDMDGFPIIDTLHTRAAHVPRTFKA